MSAASTSGAGAPTALVGGRTAPPQNADAIFVFDVDGTLSLARQSVQQDMVSCLYALREKAWVGVVGGSDQHKILEQLGAGAYSFFDFLFSENGLVAVKEGKELERRQMTQHFCEADRKRFEAYCLEHIKALVLPKKCTHHVELRSGMWNVSPIGRDCSKQERDEFEQFDHANKIREKMIALLRPEFAAMNLSFSIGGQISFDVFPRGWDKTYCLRFLDAFKQIHFFGDKTYKGGNDYEIYSSFRTVGHQTHNPTNTIQLITSALAEKAAAGAVETEARQALTPLFASTTESAASAAVKPATGAAIADLIVGYANYFFSQ